MVYVMDDLLYDLIESQDGLLGIALAWLFQQQGLDWRYSLPVPGGECDFLLLSHEKIAIEVKMLDAQSSSIESKLGEGVRQVESAARHFGAAEAWVVHTLFSRPTVTESKEESQTKGVQVAPFAVLEERLFQPQNKGVKQHG